MPGPRSRNTVAPSRRRGLAPLAGSVVTAAAVVAWLVLWRHGRGGSIVPVYAGGVIATALGAVACRRTATMIFISQPAAAFWRRLTVSLVWVTAGSVGALVAAAQHPPAVGARSGLSPWAAGPLLVGLGVAVYAFVRLPYGHRSWLRWAQLGLDGATVALAAVVFYWYVLLDIAPPGLPLATQLGAAVVGVGGLVTVIVIGKASMSLDGHLDRAALRLLSLGPAVGALAAVCLIAAADIVRLAGAVLALPLAAVAVCAAAARHQWAAGRDGSPGARRRVSVVDLMPYAAIAGTGALVVIVSVRELPWAQRSVVIGAAGIAAAVWLRQLLGLRDYRRLLAGVRGQQADLEHQANHDSLTGLANRARFGALLAERVERHNPAAVLLIDIDDFKMVNDTLGHEVGDRLLVEVARRLTAHTRDEDLPARLGGDEFAVLLAEDDPAAAGAAAGRVLEALAAPVAVGEHQLLVHASIGVAVAGAGDSPDDVLRNADIAMYEAKGAGKASWTLFEPRMRRELLDHARIGSDLHEALRRGELFLVYQPVRELATGRISAFESLVRWRHPERGVVAPPAFIPVAERSGLIVPLGRWVLNEACRQFAVWKAGDHGDGLAGIGVNVAVRQLRDPGFVADVTAALQAHGLRPGELILEVTESSVLDGPDVQATLRALHEHGVQLALDDFGTGYSSLSLVRAFPMDCLKLDKTFVDGIADGDDRGRLAVADAVAGLAATLGLFTVAEGIETVDQLVRLTELGYGRGQGYLLGRPLPAGETTRLLAREAAEAPGAARDAARGGAGEAVAA
jgi:diguanylate cyclase (GGDEF)-like protein